MVPSRIHGIRLSALALAVAAALGQPALAQEQTDSTAQEPQTLSSELYAINLESTTMPISPADRPALQAFTERTVYVVPFDIRGVTWYRLRLGFFNSKKDAETFLARLGDQFPDGWVARVDRGEVAQATSGAQARAPSLPPPSSTTGGSDPSAELMRQGRDAMLVGDFTRAIRLYSRVLESPAGPYSQDARELLGLARERSGQLPQARQEYETYLKQYPQGEGADRVRQRLLGLVTAREANPAPLRSARADNTGRGWEGFGSIAQYGRWDQFTYGGNTTSETLWITDLDYTARRHGEEYDLRARFSGEYWPDSKTSRGTDGRVSALYAEALSTGNGLSGSVGRQSRSDSGILGLFDGAILTQPLGSSNRLNLVAGTPVNPGFEDRINSHQQFYGLSLDTLQIAGAVDTNLYAIQQQVDGIVDRQAVGGEVRYLKEGRTFFGLVDYDISYATVNTALALAGFTRDNGTAFNLILDYRKLPMLTTSNALISQSVDSVSTLLDTMSETQIRQLAEDRTALSRSATVSVSVPLNKKYEVMGEITVASITGTPASGDPNAVDPNTGLPPIGSAYATPSTGTQTYYTAQVIGNDLLKAGDSTIFGTRYITEEHANTVSFSVDHRRPINENLYINPRLRMDFRHDTEAGDDNAVALGMRVSDQYMKDLWIEGEVGAERHDQKVSSGSGITDIYFVYFGIRKDF
jgi:tetratricopeptide (TPR) repeat protein